MNQIKENEKTPNIMNGIKQLTRKEKTFILNNKYLKLSYNHE